MKCPECDGEGRDPQGVECDACCGDGKAGAIQRAQIMQAEFREEFPELADRMNKIVAVAAWAGVEMFLMGMIANCGEKLEDFKRDETYDEL